MELLRVDDLRQQVPTAVKFLSCEPFLGSPGRGRDRSAPRRIGAWWPLYRRSSASSCSALVRFEIAAE
ncbi:hypothetical protein L1I79_29395 [Strepomyces sp. STD 3.1]|nr:hypothetical protein [Streptomyces sp. STD 3.1]